MMIKINLPFPPSVNHYWRTVRIGKSNQTMISKKGREYRKNAILECMAQGVSNKKFDKRLSVEIVMNPPTRHKRDIDNYIKAPLDALTHAGVWLDDEQIDKLTITRGEIIRGGRMVIKIGGCRD